MKRYYVATPAGRAGPYRNAAEAHDAARPLNFPVVPCEEPDDERDEEDDDDDDC